MAFFQYLVFDGENLPLPDSYEVELEDVEADPGVVFCYGEVACEAGRVCEAG